LSPRNETLTGFNQQGAGGQGDSATQRAENACLNAGFGPPVPTPDAPAGWIGSSCDLLISIGYLSFFGWVEDCQTPTGTPAPRQAQSQYTLPPDSPSGFNAVRPRSTASPSLVGPQFFNRNYNNTNADESFTAFYYARKIVNGECVTLACPTVSGIDNYCRALEDCT